MADEGASAAARGSMTALATFGVVQFVDTDELGMDEWNDDELRDTITNLELNGLVSSTASFFFLRPNTTCESFLRQRRVF